MDRTAARARQRLDHIDGLRGIAAMAVLVGHWGEYVGHVAPWEPLSDALLAAFRHWFSAGRLGIVAFFCISGFVIPFSFSGANPMGKFMISRFFRLYPAYWISLLVALIVVPLFSSVAFESWHIAANFTMAQTALGAPDVLGVYWTLFIELIFYGICLLAFAGRMLHSTRFNLAMIGLFLTAALVMAGYRWVHPESGLPVGLPTYLAAMHFGTIARICILDREPFACRIFWPTALALAAAVTAANTLAYLHARNELVGWIAANTGYLAGLGLFLLCALRRWFGGPVLAWFGLISYSLYLFHPIFLHVFVGLWPSMPWPVSLVVLTPLLFLGSIAAAAIVQRWIEAPAVGIGRGLNRRYNAWMSQRAQNV
jgi:peptidoglycan/LPS O-acetylase OafA/YrhL